MEIRDRINSSIEQKYAQMFDYVESDSIQEAIIKVRDKVLSRIFKKYEQKIEKISKEKLASVDIYKHFLDLEISEFKRFYEVGKSFIHEDSERQILMDAKFYELFFKIIDDNADIKVIFQYLIKELENNLDLPKEKITEYKAFIFDYYLQREKVNIFYELVVKNEEPLFERLFKLEDNDFFPVKINKGKLSLEVEAKGCKNIYEFFTRKGKKKLGFIQEDNFLLPWIASFKTKILKNSRSGTFSEILFHLTDVDNWPDYEESSKQYFISKSILMHERMHMKYAFKNSSRRQIYSDEIEAELSDKIAVQKNSRDSSTISITNLIDTCLLLPEELLKDECLATIAGSPIEVYTRDISKIIGGVSSSYKFRIDRDKQQSSSPNLEVIYSQYYTLYEELPEVYNIFKIQTYLKRKSEILKLAKTNSEKILIEKEFKEKEKLYSKLMLEISILISKFVEEFPFEKQYLLSYLESIPFKSWKTGIDTVYKILKEKYNKTL